MSAAAQPYRVRVEPDDDWLLVHVVELDQYTQARAPDEVGPMARDLIATYLDVPLDDVAVTIEW